MFDRRNKTPIGQDKPAFVKTLTLALATIVTLGFMWTGSAKAEDMMNAWDGWPDQSRAEKLGTFTYIYGSLGLISHDGSAEGGSAYGSIALDASPVPATEDSDDAFASVGFGLRLPNDFNVEFGLATLNGAYDQPTASGGLTLSRTNRFSKYLPLRALIGAGRLCCATRRVSATPFLMTPMQTIMSFSVSVWGMTRFVSNCANMISTCSRARS